MLHNENAFAFSATLQSKIVYIQQMELLLYNKFYKI